MKVSTHLHVEEIMHPQLIDRFGPPLCRKVLKKKRQYLIDTFESIRALVGEPCTINDYMYSLPYKKAVRAGHPGYSAIAGRRDLFVNSGVRIFSDPVGKALSTHYLWNAFDVKFATADPVDVQKRIMDKPLDFPYIVRMENAEITKTWLHVEADKIRLPDEFIEVFDP